jgi:Protein of unknown function (DUF3443)
VRFKHRCSRLLGALGFALLTALIASCGGGGGGGGGGGSGGNSSSAVPLNMASNQVPVTVENFQPTFINIPYVSVTVCAPGNPAACQTIDHIQLDTESFGLRLVNTAAAQVLASLPTETDGSGNMLAECANFAIGFRWGSVRTADIHIGGETASNVPIQIVGDLDSNPTTAAPSACSNTGLVQDTVAELGANGILGVGVAPFDFGNYFSCPSASSCASVAVPTAKQVTNPVTRFATDNNGVILSMPALSDTGAPSATGTLTFGIDTQSNNAFAASQKFSTNAVGDVPAMFNNSQVTAFFDSASNAYFFHDPTLSLCSSSSSSFSFYCPPTATTRNVVVSSSTVTMKIANAQQLEQQLPGNFAFDNVAADFGSDLAQFVDLGMPFFYGKTVYYGFDQTATGGQSPYIAF